MARKSIFTMVSLESHSVSNRRFNKYARLSLEEAAAALSDDITSDNELVQIEQDNANIAEATAAVEEGVEVLDDTIDQVEEQEQILEQAPEQVTEEVVQVAQEAFAYNMGRLQVPFDEFRRTKASVESYNTTPIAKLRATMEEEKGFIAKIIEKIKAFFSRIWEWIKGLFSKSAPQIEKNAETALAIGASLKNRSLKEVEDMRKNGIFAKVGELVLPVTGNSGGGDSVRNLLTMITADFAYLTGMADALKGFGNIKVGVDPQTMFDSLKTESDNIFKIFSSTFSNIGEHFNIESALTKSNMSSNYVVLGTYNAKIAYIALLEGDMVKTERATDTGGKDTKYANEMYLHFDTLDALDVVKKTPDEVGKYICDTQHGKLWKYFEDYVAETRKHAAKLKNLDDKVKNFKTESDKILSNLNKLSALQAGEAKQAASRMVSYLTKSLTAVTSAQAFIVNELRAGQTTMHKVIDLTTELNSVGNDPEDAVTF